VSARDGAAQAEDDATYICTRVLDALLREDVRGCVSRGQLVPTGAFANGWDFPATQGWLEIGHWADGRIWIPVSPERFMQSWRLAQLPLLAEVDGRVQALAGLDAILARFAAGTDADTRGRFDAFAQECAVAVAHRTAAESARRSWFADGAQQQPEAWHQQMLRHDRLASYLDHPLYPTARAKLGFAVDDLLRYAPEFSSTFTLHWLAVPRGLVHARGDRLPPGWPTFADVGLPPQLATDHALVPVHPFVWDGELHALLAEADLAQRVIRAPRTHLRVRPTLSVRSLVLDHAPEWHLKLPLTIRTLGAKNIRTIKPSTIHDGQLVQDLLAEIACGEPLLRDRLLLTTEDTGAHVDGRTFLGYIVRRYPAHDLQGCTPVPVAGLLAPAPEGGCVAEELARRFYASASAAAHSARMVSMHCRTRA
jgi:siderophore synthetase component